MPTGNDDIVAGHGAITLDGTGHGRTDDMTLADGHYKLTWDFDAEHGAGKHKVFWVDCGDDNGATTGETANGGDTNGGDTSGTTGQTTGQTTSGGDTSGDTSGGATGTTGSTAAAGGSSTGTPSSTPSTGTDTSGTLAETGSSVIGLSALAAVLLAAGGTVLFRRRAGSRH